MPIKHQDIRVHPDREAGLICFIMASMRVSSIVCACCTRGDQRDLLAAKLLEAAYEGVGSASSSRDLGADLPRLTALVQLVAPHEARLQHQSSAQQPEDHTMNGIGTGPNPGSCSMQTTNGWNRDHSNNLSGSETISPWQSSQMGATEAPNSSRKRQADEYPGDVMGSQPKRQQTVRDPRPPISADLAVSSTAPTTSNVASLMTNLEQEVTPSSHSLINVIVRMRCTAVRPVVSVCVLSLCRRRWPS